MKNYKLEVGAGENFDEVIKTAKEITQKKKVIVEFDFNGITCLISEETVLDWFTRDYRNSHIMEWKTIGPECKMMYDNDTEIELRTRQLERAKKWKEDADKQASEDKKKEKIITEKVYATKLEIINGKEKEYKDYVKANNKDGYSYAVIEYGEAWGKLMQKEISKGIAVKDCADETQKGLDYLGITGFQYGCVVKALAHFWKHGEELRKWHNKEYGVDENEKGVVNPAILTFK